MNWLSAGQLVVFPSHAALTELVLYCRCRHDPKKQQKSSMKASSIFRSATSEILPDQRKRVRHVPSLRQIASISGHVELTMEHFCWHSLDQPGPQLYQLQRLMLSGVSLVEGSKTLELLPCSIQFLCFSLLCCIPNQNGQKSSNNRYSDLSRVQQHSHFGYRAEYFVVDNATNFSLVTILRNMQSISQVFQNARFDITQNPLRTKCTQNIRI